ncbi:unnamed protein product [Rotaria sordida]|uniref:gamma-glutamylcyclotransferase n=1 Tax=Rotaria sordida TaxID=392033 RepID=A0A814WVR3_9BILA|nr:unnamed protein product [Rotaria sordida]CAF1583149.1 unnamed protein product [Rotaria sordida]
MADSVHRLNTSLSDENFKQSCASIRDKLVHLDQSSIDSILEHDDPQKAEIVLPDGRQFIWYFAIGSMNNPISLYLRDLYPIVSYPVVCPNYRVIFRSPSGMADIESDPGAEFHGVVHLLSNDEMARLDKMEGMYRRIPVNVIDYQGQSHLVYAYTMIIPNKTVGLPSERYLDIIVKGCEYYNVQPEYINRLKQEQALVPRKQPQEFQSFTDIPIDAFFSTDELARHDGTDPTLPMWICINGKILEYSGLPPADHPEYEERRRFYSFFQPRWGGRQADYGFAKGLYEPLYKIPLNEEDLSDEHRAMIEDLFITMIIKNSQNINYWKLIGRLLRSDTKLSTSHVHLN